MNLADLRQSYTKAGLLEAEVDPDPFAQFQIWFGQAVAASVPEPNAMALATVSADGVPGARMVLLKSFDAQGFVFYSNYESRKALDLAINPHASLLFYWTELERQIRITGTVEKIADTESEQYFQSRPVGHQLGAWASRQSSVIEGRAALEAGLAETIRRFGDGPVSKPPYWGGYRVRPDSIEFWQGRPNRLHDRIEYVRTSQRWTIRRLAP